MAERCPDCGRPFAATAHEQAYPAWCNGAASYGCLRARIAKLEEENRRAKKLLSAVLNGLDGDSWQSDVEELLVGLPPQPQPSERVEDAADGEDTKT